MCCDAIPPSAPPHGYFPIYGHDGADDEAAAGVGDRSGDIDPAFATVPRTVQREKSWTESVDAEKLQREISASFSDISIIPRRIDPDAARRSVEKRFLIKVYSVLILQLGLTFFVCLVCMKCEPLLSLIVGGTSGTAGLWRVFYIMLAPVAVFLLAFYVLIFYKNHYPWNGMLLALMNLSLSAMIGVMCARFQADGTGYFVLFAFGITITVFIALTLVVAVFPARVFVCVSARSLACVRVCVRACVRACPASCPARSRTDTPSHPRSYEQVLIR